MFKEPVCRSGYEYQRRRHGEHHLGVMTERRAYPVAVFVEQPWNSIFKKIKQLPPDGKPESAQYYERHGDEVDAYISGVGNKAVISYNIYSRIAECGYGMKNRIPDSAPYSEDGNEIKRIEQGSCRFNRKNSEKGVSEKMNHMYGRIHIEGVFNKQSFSERYASSHYDGAHGHKRNGTHSADLYQNKNDNMPEGAPMRRRRNGDKSRYTYARRSCE